MKWRSEFETGIPRIDKQHQMLFMMAEDFRSSLDEGGGDRVYRTLLDFLDGYARGHFRFEEKCMEEHQCPVAQKNKDAHAGLLRLLGDYQQRFAAGGYVPEDARTLVDTLDQWLVDHICGIDVHLKACIGN